VGRENESKNEIEKIEIFNGLPIIRTANSVN
jgi:hypothetical protein